MKSSQLLATADPARLNSYSVLIVEDDYFVATELARVLEINGAHVLGPVSSIDAGRRLATDRAPDCVLLDVNLKGQHTFELAEELRQRGVATIFTTGYDIHALPGHLRDMKCLRKPVDIDALVQCIRTQPRRRLDS